MRAYAHLAAIVALCGTFAASGATATAHAGETQPGHLASSKAKKKLQRQLTAARKALARRPA